jgi:NitT/TauT family transport system permease protein
MSAPTSAPDALATPPAGPVADPRAGVRIGAGLRDMGPPLLTAVLVLVLWEGVVRGFGIRPILLPTPSAILTAFVGDLPRLGNAIWTTGRAAILGFVIGGIAGFTAGAVAARFAWLREGVLPMGVAFGAIPIVATAPIFNLWFSALSVWSNAAVVALVVFFPMLVNTITGLTAVAPGHAELVRSLAMPRWSVFAKLQVPTALPYVFGALRLGAALAVIAAVVADFFGGFRSSSGFFIKTLMATADYTGAWATVLALCLFGLSLYGLVALVERRTIPEGG